MKNQNTVKLSETAAKKELGQEVGRILDTLIGAQHMEADYFSLLHRTGRMRKTPSRELHVETLDKDLNPLGYESPVFHFEEIHGDDAEWAQAWIVSDWLAAKLAENDRECVVLLCGEHYVWLRHGCGYSIEDDFRFLDEDDDEQVQDITHEDADEISDGRGDFETINPSDC
tara:strand:- start:88 stop:600 length:513 start_codon:yes stop_codon:yes gene_type:complete